ncbi:MAG: L,D-transpeptidase family protein [Thermomicrobiales bacterium]
MRHHLLPSPQHAPDAQHDTDGRPARLLSRRAVVASLAGTGLAVIPLIAGAQDQVIEPEGSETPEPTPDAPVNEPSQIIEPSDPDAPVPTPADSQGIDVPATEAGDTESSLYFAATGHNLTTPFLDIWQQLGGEKVAGQPLSEGRFVDTTGTVQQVFEGISLDYTPVADGPGVIKGIALPDAVAKKAFGSTARTGSGGFTVDPAIASLWNQFADLLGQPASQSVAKNGVISQLFTNAVVDGAKDGSLSLRRVMVDVVSGSSLATDPAFVPAPPTLGKTTLVSASDGLRLRATPDADGAVRVVIPDSAEFIAAGTSDGGWVPGYVDGYSGWVAAAFLKEPTALPTLDLKDWDLTVWQGAALGETNLRAQSTTTSKMMKSLVYGDPVTIVEWVKGEEVYEAADVWAKTKEGTYVYARNIGRSAPVAATPLPADAPTDGKWIDVNLTQQLMVAYEGRTAVRVCVTTTGMPGWETPTGWFAINNRVANETMGSGSIGAENFFELKNVLFTQYFTDVGHAIHFAWWRTKETIGRPGSHGCLNLLLDDSQFFWDWATYGTPVIIRRS